MTDELKQANPSHPLIRALLLSKYIGQAIGSEGETSDEVSAHEGGKMLETIGLDNAAVELATAAINIRAVQTGEPPDDEPLTPEVDCIMTGIMVGWVAAHLAMESPKAMQMQMVAAARKSVDFSRFPDGPPAPG